MRVDTPQIDASGIVYQDDLYRRDDGKGRVVMKFVPRAEVERAISRGGRPIRTGGIVRDFSIDRQRIAIAVADPRGVCDRILFWNISWNYVSRLTSSTEATCAPGHAAGGITDVALGGIIAEWVTRYGDTSTVLSANIVACREWVIGHLRNGPGGDRLGGIAADGALLAYAVGRHERELRGQFVLGKVIREGVRGEAIADGVGVPTAVPRGVRAAIDLHFGVAVLTSGTRVYGVDMASGRTALLAEAPATARAEIEAPGIVYQFNRDGHGYLRFIPFAAVRSALR